MPRVKSALAPHKVRLIQVAKRQLGLDDADYRNILRRVAAVETSKELTDTGFSQLMDTFAHLGFQSTSEAANFGRRDGFATAGQVAIIRRLWLEYTGNEGTDATLGKWLEDKWRTSALRFLPEQHAPKVITALKAMVARRSTASNVA